MVEQNDAEIAEGMKLQQKEIDDRLKEAQLND